MDCNTLHFILCICEKKCLRQFSESSTAQYYLDESKAVKIKYLYDENSIIGMLYTSGSTTATYYFQRNLLGDVIGIYNTSGTKVAGYAYDAWGNYTITSDTTNYDVAVDNPIRYRGYYYDDNTNLYYLNARYYSPELKRFISPDDTAYLDPETPNGLNLYCYCGNDPVNLVDPSGHLAATAIAIIVGAFIGFGISATSSVVTQLEEHNGNWNEVNPFKVLYDGAFGAINGALAASGVGLGWSIALGATSGLLSSVGSDLLFENGNINWSAAVSALVVGALAGVIAGAGANSVKEGMQVTKFINSKNVLNRTIANGTKRAIARQTSALNVHTTQLLIAGVRYMLSNTFSISYTMFTN